MQEKTSELETVSAQVGLRIQYFNLETYGAPGR